MPLPLTARGHRQRYQVGGDPPGGMSVRHIAYPNRDRKIVEGPFPLCKNPCPDETSGPASPLPPVRSSPRPPRRPSPPPQTRPITHCRPIQTRSMSVSFQRPPKDREKLP